MLSQALQAWAAGHPSLRLLTHPDQMAPFLLDWRKRYQGRALAVAQPSCTADVAALVAWCQAHRVAVVPQGGNTGLSGGATPDASGQSVVLSLARMRQVRGIDLDNHTLTAEAGCTLQQVQDAAQAAGLLFPLSLASEGSCTLGGNLSTNAGGVQVLRYGNARELCLGLEVVTAQGEVWDGLRGLRKDNTGYDLRDLFIGAEGTLGVITAAVMKLYPQPRSEATAWAATGSLREAQALLRLARRHLDASLTAFEVVGEAALGLVLRHVPGTRAPLASPSPWQVLLQCGSASPGLAAHEALQALLEEALSQGLVQDAVLAESQDQARQLWKLRESVSEAQAAEGPNIKHDIALPADTLAPFVDEAQAALQAAHPGCRLIVFGHLGDGNLHFNVSPPLGEAHQAFLARQHDVHHITHDLVHRHRGSISAEHGLGQLRRDENARLKSPVELRLQRAIKQALDPLGLMNPGKVLG